VVALKLAQTRGSQRTHWPEAFYENHFIPMAFLQMFIGENRLSTKLKKTDNRLIDAKPVSVFI
jgi:hypothetical protein